MQLLSSTLGVPLALTFNISQMESIIIQVTFNLDLVLTLIIFTKPYQVGDHHIPSFTGEETVV